MTGDGWRQAGSGHVWRFPGDHGSHPEYRIEWWYYTGNLASDRGRRFGYQVTFFRVGVDPAPENPSRWAVRDLHMAHLAVTDLESGRHLFGERLDRGGLGWAGARAGTLDVWNGDWRASLDGGLHRLEVVDRSFGVDLRLEPGKGPVLHGEDGLSRKGPSAGNASRYYSMTRMPTTGRVRLDGEWIDVPARAGWTTSSARRSSSRARWAGTGSRCSSTTARISWSSSCAAPTGDPTTIPPAPGWTARARRRRWIAMTCASCPDGGGRRRPAAPPTPSNGGWSCRGAGVSLDVAAALDAQELDTAASTGVTYWEGAVTVTGRVGDRPVRGRGYLEMTGYSGRR